MSNKTNEYYFLEINVTHMKVVDWGETNTATLSGETQDPNVFRLFLTKGQFNKFKKHVAQF